MNFDWKQIFIAAIAYLIISQVIFAIGTFLTMSYYQDPAYFPLWSKLMMPDQGSPGAEFFAYSIAFGIIIGLCLAFAYAVIKNGMPVTSLGKGASYGALLFLVSTLPFILTLYLLTAIPDALLFSWTIEMLVIYVLSGLAFERLIT